LRAKFTNDLNFFVREVVRGIGVLERSLEIAEMLRGGKETMKSGGRKKVRENVSLNTFINKVAAAVVQRHSLGYANYCFCIISPQTSNTKRARSHCPIY